MKTKHIIVGALSVIILINVITINFLIQQNKEEAFNFSGNTAATVNSVSVPDTTENQAEKLRSLLQTVDQLTEEIKNLPDKSSQNTITDTVASKPNATISISFSDNSQELRLEPIDLGKEVNVTLKIKVQNGPAKFQDINGLNNSIKYAGGSYPGKGGTCSAVIANDCTIVLTFQPHSVDGRKIAVQLNYSSNIVLNFENNNSEISQSNPIKLTGYSPLLSTATLSPATTPILFFLGQNPDYVEKVEVIGNIGNYSLEKVDYPFSIKKVECAEDKNTTFEVPGASKRSNCNITFGFVASDIGSHILPIVFNYFDGEKEVQISKNVVFKVSKGSDLNLTPENNLLIVYNEKSTDGKKIKDYYLANRPGFANANVLSINYPFTGCFFSCGNADDEIAAIPIYERSIEKPITNWINSHPEKDIRHVVLIRGIPTRVYLVDPPRGINGLGGVTIYTKSLQHALATIFENQADCNRNDISFPTDRYNPNAGSKACGAVPKEESIGFYSRARYPGTLALFTELDMGSLEATLAYIDKLKAMYNSMQHPSIFISAEDAGKAGSTYYFEDNNQVAGANGNNGMKARDEILKVNPNAIVDYHPYDSEYIHNAPDVKGFMTWGGNSSRGGQYITDGTLTFTGNSNWYLIQTMESFNGQLQERGQGRYLYWFSKNAFGGENYNKTPVAAVTHTDEPGLDGVNSPFYFSCWEGGNLFIDCAWYSRLSNMMMAIGDPWIVK